MIKVIEKYYMLDIYCWRVDWQFQSAHCSILWHEPLLNLMIGYAPADIKLSTASESEISHLALYVMAYSAWAVAIH